MLNFSSIQNVKKMPLLPETATADNLSESDYLLCYYRLDEGPGAVELIDASDKKINAHLVTTNDAIWSEELALGEPLEYEDRWGTKATPNRALKVDKQNFIQIKSNEKLSIMAFTFTIEMWIKIEDLTGENCILESSNKSIIMSIKGNTFVVINGQKHIEIESQTTLKKNEWTHIAIVWHRDALRPISVLVNGATIGTSNEILADKDWASEHLNLCLFKGEVTEIRIWEVNLNEKIITDNMKTPLSILANRQNIIQFVIKKKPIENKTSGLQKKLLARPPISGFMAEPTLMKHNSLAPPMRSNFKLPEDSKETADPFVSRSSFVPPPKSELSELIKEHTPLADAPKPTITIPQHDSLNPCSVSSTKRESFVPQSKHIPEEPKRNSLGIPGNNELKTELPVNNEEEKMPFETSGENTKEEPLIGRISNIWTVDPPSRISVDKTAKPIAITKTAILSEVAGHLLAGNLKTTIKYVEEYLKSIGTSDSIGINEKKIISQLSRYKLIVKILSVIHQLKKKSDVDSIRKAADLANIVVVLRVNRKLKFNFYKLALSRNMKAKNYRSAIKLINHALQDTKLTAMERKSFTDNIEECKKQGGTDASLPNVFCPSCEAKLPYGTASPICKACNMQLLFCYRVILEKQHKKCDMCSAVYSMDYSAAKCEYCYLGNISQILLIP